MSLFNFYIFFIIRVIFDFIRIRVNLFKYIFLHIIVYLKVGKSHNFKYAKKIFIHCNDEKITVKL